MPQPPTRPATATGRFASKVASCLAQIYPEAKCSLDYADPVQLLVATILSAQCTDRRVNEVTKKLFARGASAATLARMPLARLEEKIKSTGFFRNKAKSIKGCCQTLVRQYGGRVPEALDKLVELPGVGRKTANVVLGTAYGIPSGVVVDTHVGRISRRLGLTGHKDPTKVETDLMRLLPRSEWIVISHRMIQHGRRYCKARRPLCDECPLGDLCPRIGVEGSG